MAPKTRLDFDGCAPCTDTADGRPTRRAAGCSIESRAMEGVEARGQARHLTPQQADLLGIRHRAGTGRRKVKTGNDRIERSARQGFCPRHDVQNPCMRATGYQDIAVALVNKQALLVQKRVGHKFALSVACEQAPVRRGKAHAPLPRTRTAAGHRPMRALRRGHDALVFSERGIEPDAAMPLARAGQVLLERVLANIHGRRARHVRALFAQDTPSSRRRGRYARAR